MTLLCAFMIGSTLTGVGVERGAVRLPGSGCHPAGEGPGRFIAQSAPAFGLPTLPKSPGPRIEEDARTGLDLRCDDLESAEESVGTPCKSM